MFGGFVGCASWVGVIVGCGWCLLVAMVWVRLVDWAVIGWLILELVCCGVVVVWQFWFAFVRFSCAYLVCMVCINSVGICIFIIWI